MWIDIESLRYAEDTISIYLDIFKENRRTGLVIQSYLRRSHSDLMHLVELGNNFSRLRRVMCDHITSDEILAIANHDTKLVKEAISLLKGREIIKSI